MRLNIAFWNLGRRNLGAPVRALVESEDIDLLILAELPKDAAAITQELTSLPKGTYEQPAFWVNERVFLFTHYSHAFFHPVADFSTASIQELRLPCQPALLLVCAHLYSKRSHNDTSQLSAAVDLAEQIRRCEGQVAHENTILIGDLNCDPFELAAVDVHALNGVKCRHVTKRASRTTNDKTRPYFYNPMWSLLGDLAKQPPGTHYWTGSTNVEYYWRTYDQVMVRASLVETLEPDSLRIITKIATHQLARPNGRPDKAHYSDHFPITVTLDLSKVGGLNAG
jgi:hypothetical protein